MLLVIQYFAAPLIVVIIGYIISRQLDVPQRIRIPLIVLLSGAAIGALLLFNKPGVQVTVRPTLGAEAQLQSNGASAEPSHELPRRTGTDISQEQGAIPSKAPRVGDFVDDPSAQSPRNAWPVLMYHEDGASDVVLREAAKQTLLQRGRTVPAIFKDSIAVEKENELFRAEAGLVSSLTRYCDGMVMGRVTSRTKHTDEFGDMYATDLTVDVKLVSTITRKQDEFVLQETGAGFSPEQAMTNAQQRLATKLSNQLLRFLP